MSSFYGDSMNNEKRQIAGRPAVSTIRKVHPSHREVLLARLLLQLIDELGKREDLDVELYNEVKSFAEPIVRGGS